MPLHLNHFDVGDWVPHKNAHPEHKTTFFVSLAYQNKAEMHQELMEISDPNHSRYGLHYSLEKLRSTFSVSADKLREVTEFFQGITDSTIEVNEGR